MTIAKDFALVNLTKDKFPVIFAIHFNSQKGLIAMNEECSAYNESEVLVQDGLRYLVIDNIEKFTKDTNLKFYLIQLSFQAKAWT